MTSSCVFAAQSEEEVQDWVSAISEVCKYDESSPAELQLRRRIRSSSTNALPDLESHLTDPFMSAVHNDDSPLLNPHNANNNNNKDNNSNVSDSSSSSGGGGGGDEPSSSSSSYDSFNLLLQRLFRDLQDSKVFHNDLLRRFQRKFTKIERPGWLGEISVAELDVGERMVELRNVRVQPTCLANELIGEADVLYEGGVSLTITTNFFLNWPRERFASVPILAKVRFCHLSGKIFLYGPPELQSRFSLSFAELPKAKIEFDIRVGENDFQVMKLPKLNDWLLSVFRKVLYERTVFPNRITFSLPFPGRKFNFKLECVTKKSTNAPVSRPQPNLVIDGAEQYARKFLVTRYVEEVLNQGQFHVIDELFDKSVIVSGVIYAPPQTPHHHHHHHHHHHLAPPPPPNTTTATNSNTNSTSNGSSASSNSMMSKESVSSGGNGEAEKKGKSAKKNRKNNTKRKNQTTATASSDSESSSSSSSSSDSESSSSTSSSSSSSSHNERVGNDSASSTMVQGIDAVKKLVVDLRCAFPNISFTIQDLACESDFVICRFVGRGTHSGKIWELPPTGRQIDLSALVLHRFHGERIIEQSNYWDMPALLSQLQRSKAERPLLSMD